MRFPRNLIQLHRDDREAEELSRIYSKIYYILSFDFTLPGMGTPIGEEMITIYSVVYLIPYLIFGVAGM